MKPVIIPIKSFKDNCLQILSSAIQGNSFLSHNNCSIIQNIEQILYQIRIKIFQRHNLIFTKCLEAQGVLHK